MRIQNLKLTHFRNIESTNLQLNNADVVALYGNNGAGKTSVLEALALLTPGRGLHRSTLDSHVQQGAESWAIFTDIQANNETHTIGQQYAEKKRVVKVNGEALKAQSQLSKFGNVLWLTPKMDRLFMDGTQSRREFFDRLVFGLFPNHAEQLARYKHHIKARMTLLKQRADTDWISLEEQQAATLAKQIQHNRMQYLEKFHQHAENIQLKISHMGENYIETWAQQREQDMAKGMTHTGPHRLQVSGLLLPENIKLNQTSTGQHKRAVLNILLTNAKVIAAESGTPPLLLMDEITAHLDPTTRKHFFNAFTALGAQVWLTGTEKELFDGLEGCLHIHVNNGQFSLTSSTQSIQYI